MRTRRCTSPLGLRRRGLEGMRDGDTAAGLPVLSEPHVISPALISNFWAWGCRGLLRIALEQLQETPYLSSNSKKGGVSKKTHSSRPPTQAPVLAGHPNTPLHPFLLRAQ
jgi:hypothetical protein